MKTRRTRRILAPTLLGLSLVALALAFRISDNAGLRQLRERLEWVAFDLRTRATLDRHAGKDPRVVIVDIDERSLRVEGHWPWPREKIATLLDRLFGYGAVVVGLDMVLSEAEPNAATRVAEELAKRPGLGEAALIEQLRVLSGALDPDAALAHGLAKQPVVLGYVLTDRADRSVGELPPPLLSLDTPALGTLALYGPPQYVANLPALQQAAAGGGFFSVHADDDGVVRRVPLIARHGEAVYGSLALEVARSYLGMPPAELRLGEIAGRPALEAVSLAGFVDMPTDEFGQVIVPYRGPKGSFPYVSATDVLRGAASAQVLRDAIVLVGTSAEGLYDQRSTPVESVFPGVEIHANVIAGILDGRFPFEPSWATGVDLSVLAALGLVLALVFPRLNALGLAAATAVGIGAYVAVNTWVWVKQGLVMTVAVPVLMVLLLGTLNMTYGFLAERRNRERLKGMFGQYVPAALVEEMNARPEGSFGFEGESREMTVLFCDIRGFTSISETLPANELKKMLNFFFTPMTQIIFERRGTVDKYVGDMIMAFWGAPLRDPEHRGHGIQAALDMLASVERLRPELRERGWPEIRIGIGLNTGLMNVGDMGSSFRRAYTVIGDAVNLGSRLESLTKYYGVNLIVSEVTRQGQEEFLFRPLDRVRVKGKAEPVDIFEPLCRQEVADEALRAELYEYDMALGTYYTQQWEEAESRFAALIQRHPGRKVYLLYSERSRELMAQGVGSDWDGVFTHTSK